jgi:hypothetical protein
MLKKLMNYQPTNKNIMTVKTFKLYNFEDLSKEAQEKAIQNYIESQYNFADYLEEIDQSWTLQDIKENVLEEFGFIEPEISYSGFYNQGDGASFTFANIDLEIFLKKNKIKSKFKILAKYNDFITINGYRNTHLYSHENTVDIRSEIENYLDVSDSHIDRVKNALDKKIEEFEEYLENWIVEKCKEIYKTLENDFEYQTSEEYARESLAENTYEYLEDGTIY